LRTGASVRYRLLGWLLLPLIALLLAGTLLDYVTALGPANAAYDQALTDAAMAIAGQIKAEHGELIVDLPTAATKVLRTDQYDRIYFAVMGPNGNIIAGDQGLPLLPEPRASKGPARYDDEYKGKPVRLVALPVTVGGMNARVLVGETTIKRTRLAHQILSGMLLPEVLFAAAALTLVWIGVGRGLAPLQRLILEIATRSHADLRPVAEDRVPAEVRPVVHAINDLLKRLEILLRAQRQFLADAAHQLRTPLTGLQVRLEMGLSQSSPEQWQSTLASLKQTTEKTARLANQLLTLARAEAGGQLLTAISELNLRELAQEVGQDWLHRALARQLDLGFELAEVVISADPLLIRELLSNLVGNAVGYTDSRGKITVRCGAFAARAFLEVEDEGPGIPESERVKVFHRFYRIEGAPGNGCGLGLAIVREIATAHGGSVEIVTPTSGRGTLMRVWLPISHPFATAGETRAETSV
jgi:signal transduction histidine kinase